MTFYSRKRRALLVITIIIVFLLIAFKWFLKPEKLGSSEAGSEVFFSKESGFYEDAFELELSSDSGTVYYTLDGSVPNKNSIKYEKPISISDASIQENVHSMRTDVSTGFEKEEIEKVSSEYPGYQVPDYKIDKATIVRAVVYDGYGNYSDIKTATYFVGFEQKKGYEGMRILSVVTDPSNLFDYENGIYVTGKTYDEYVKEYRGSGEWYWREEFWGLWEANYRNRGKEWERKASCAFFDETGILEHEQECGIRVHGGLSRGYNPKSLNIYVREEYDGNKTFGKDLFGTGYDAAAVTLFQGGQDARTKAKDIIISSAVKDLDVATMNYVPYVLFLNGEYWGVYWLNEKYDANFFEHYYGVNKDNVIMIKSGEPEVGEEEDYQYFEKMVEFCVNNDVTKEENYQKVCDMIDMESYIDYYAIMCYVGRCGDWPWLNYGTWRVKKTESGPYGDGKWRWVIFDLNSPGFRTELDTIQYVMENDAMFCNLMTNDTFRTQLVQRMEELMETVFNYDTMSEWLDEYSEFMEEPMSVNSKRFYGDDSSAVFYNEIDGLKNFFRVRKEYLIPILDKYR